MRGRPRHGNCMESDADRRNERSFDVTHRLHQPLGCLGGHVQIGFINAGLLVHRRHGGDDLKGRAACDAVPTQDRLLVLAVKHLTRSSVLAQSVHMRLQETRSDAHAPGHSSALVLYQMNAWALLNRYA